MPLWCCPGNDYKHKMKDSGLFHTWLRCVDNECCQLSPTHEIKQESLSAFRRCIMRCVALDWQVGGPLVKTGMQRVLSTTWWQWRQQWQRRQGDSWTASPSTTRPKRSWNRTIEWLTFWWCSHLATWAQCLRSWVSSWTVWRLLSSTWSPERRIRSWRRKEPFVPEGNMQQMRAHFTECTSATRIEAAKVLTTESASPHWTETS